MLVDSCLCIQGIEYYQISLTKVVGMMCFKNFKNLYACDVPFNVLIPHYWHEMVQAINGDPEGYKSPGYEKARTMGHGTW
jgi:hypothetical protein